MEMEMEMYCLSVTVEAVPTTVMKATEMKD
jgi:hypothetical protein